MLHRITAFRGRQIYGWVLFVTLFGTMIGAFLDHSRDLRGRVELGAFRSSLGALRVALVIEQMRVVTSGAPSATSTTLNPFKFLQTRPSNYAGEISLADASAGALEKAFWFYGPGCRCIGYRPGNEQRFVAPSGARLMVFGVVPDHGTPQPGMVGVLVGRERYTWWGESIQ